MGGLVSYFKGLFGSREMRILILGLDGAGKTTLLYRLQVQQQEYVYLENDQVPEVGIIQCFTVPNNEEKAAACDESSL